MLDVGILFLGSFHWYISIRMAVFIKILSTMIPTETAMISSPLPLIRMSRIPGIRIAYSLPIEEALILYLGISD